MSGDKHITLPLCEFVELVRKLNKDLVTTTLIGVDVSKNLIGKVKGKKTDLRTLQIVEKGCFVMSGMSPGRDKRVPVALYMGDKPLLTSQSGRYYVFKVTCPYLKAEYLNLIFKTERVDRLGVYLSGSGCRGELEWEKFSKILISTPDLEFQEKIVHKYETVSKYIEVKKKINELLERQMRAYFHILFDDLRDYETKTFGELFSIIRGGRPPRSNRWLEELYFCKEGGVPWLQQRDITKKEFKFVWETLEKLTQEGVLGAKCQIVHPNSLIFTKVTTSSCVGNIYVCAKPLTIDTNLWAFSCGLAGGGINIVCL